MPEYQLDALGWFQFERLCQSLLQSDHGLSVETWGGSGDFGRDAYADGPLDFPKQGIQAPGPYIFQAKFVQGANATGAKPKDALLKAVKAEATRIQKRRDDGTWEDPRVYVLMTNAPLTPAVRKVLHAEIKNAVPAAKRVVLQGAADLDAWLDRSSAVRMSFPQLLGVRDLTALLDSIVSRDVRSRSTLGLEAAASLAEVFVPTRAYNQALTTLSGHGFTVLTGAPEMGKTAIARMVALARFTGGWEAFECRGPDDFFRTYDRDKAQVFVADDAFGSTEYRPELAANWAADLDKLLRATDHRHWLLLTSRPGPLNEGLERLHLQDKAERFPAPAQVQVDASALTEQERALILYRHAKAAGLEERATALVQASARAIVGSTHFTPLRIQRLVAQLKAIAAEPENDQIDLLKAAVVVGLREPTRPMVTSFNALDGEHKQLLIAMLDAGARGVSIEALDERYAARFTGPPARSAAEVAASIEEHFVRLSDEQE